MEPQDARKLHKAATGGTAVASALSRFCVAHQALLYFPLLLMARMMWALQSLAFVFRWSGMYWTPR